jgi:tripartite-type tricarboxylate transporter receptor subunit TctC
LTHQAGNLPSSVEHIRAGKLRALAVTTTARSDALPDVPTVDQFVPGYEASAFFGIIAPRNTPPEVIGRLNMEINAILADPKAKARLADMGGAMLPGPPANFGRLLASETEKWAKVVKFAGIGRVDIVFAARIQDWEPKPKRVRRSLHVSSL